MRCVLGEASGFMAFSRCSACETKWWFFVLFVRSTLLLPCARAREYPASVLPALAVLELFCTVVYVVPRAAELGAVILTGYLGGAVATHVRGGEAFVVPLLLGVLLWAGRLGVVVGESLRVDDEAAHWKRDRRRQAGRKREELVSVAVGHH